jgi:hypothetical protein
MVNQMTHADIAFSFDGAWPISTVTPLSALYGFDLTDFDLTGQSSTASGR